MEATGNINNCKINEHNHFSFHADFVLVIWYNTFYNTHTRTHQSMVHMGLVKFLNSAQYASKLSKSSFLKQSYFEF